MIDFRTAACTIGVTENELLDLVHEQHVPFPATCTFQGDELVVAWSDDQLPALKGALSCGNNK